MADDTLRFISDFRLADAPASIVDKAKWSLLDLIGVAAAGSRLSVSRITRSVAQSQFGGVTAGFLFDGRKASAAGAALANAMTIDSFDAHDGHALTKGHAGCGALAGLLAFAGEGQGITGAEALAHLIVGYEIGTRAGIALHATAAEYHTSGAWVSLGVAAIGARLLGLDATASREALGIAEFYGPRSQMMRCIDHPTMVKDGSGWGAMAGIMAAMMAREGFTGAPAVTVEGAEIDVLWADLGRRWRIGEQYSKPYPVCRWAQPAMEAAAGLMREHTIDHRAVRAITVRTFTEAARLATAEPRESDAAQYSLPFPLAALLVRGRVGPAEIDGPALRDPDILRLSRAVEPIDDPRFSSLFPAERWAEVEIHLDDGTRLASPPTEARGNAENPLSEAEMRRKFQELMEAGDVAERAHQIEETVMTLDGAASIAPLIDTICRPPSAHAPAEASAVA